jgi:hypothetical protein
MTAVAGPTACRRSSRFRLEIGSDDIDDSAERIANTEMVEQTLGVPHRAVGVDDFAAAQLSQCGHQRRIGRHAGQVNVMHKGKKLMRVDPVDGHQSTQGRAVFAKIGAAQLGRGLG